MFQCARGQSSSDSGSEDYRYTGKSVDVTGLYYFGARYYDPDTGRFITRDTVFGDLSDPQSLNRYVYCRNNPQKYTDPDGHLGLVAALLIGTIAFTTAHVATSMRNYEKSRNPLMTESYHKWERNRVMVKEITRGIIKGSLITATSIAVAVSPIPVPNKAAAVTSAVIMADLISAPVATSVAVTYDKITNGPFSKETHAKEMLESTMEPAFTASDQVKQNYVDPILDQYPLIKPAINDMYESLKERLLYNTYKMYFDNSYDYVEQRRGV